MVATLENENVKISYISVALNKEYALEWIRQIKLILWRCCEYLDNLKPDVPSELHSILLLLHTLVNFTSISTWRILHTQKSMEPLKPGMVQLCANLMGHLFMRGFYLTLKAREFFYCFMKRLCRSVRICNGALLNQFTVLVNNYVFIYFLIMKS